MHICRSGEIGRRTGLKIQRALRLVSVRLRPSAPSFRISYLANRILPEIQDILIKFFN